MNLTFGNKSLNHISSNKNNNNNDRNYFVNSYQQKKTIGNYSLTSINNNYNNINYNRNNNYDRINYNNNYHKRSVLYNTNTNRNKNLKYIYHYDNYFVNTPKSFNKNNYNINTNTNTNSNNNDNDISDNNIKKNVSNNNENEKNKINKIKANNEIKEFKDIYSDINEEKINIIFIMPNKEKKGFKIPSNFTKKEIYSTAYNLSDFQKDIFETDLLKLNFNGNILNNDDSIEKLKNYDEIEIKKQSIISCLDFSDLIKGSTSQIKRKFSFIDNINQRIRVDLPDDITISEIIDNINSIYNNLFDPNRVTYEILFKNKILEKKNKHIKEVNRFKKIDDVHINIKVKIKVCPQKKPGRIFNVKIFENSKNKHPSEISFGTLEKIKDFYEDLKNELSKKKIESFVPSFELEGGQKLDLNKTDERTFFSINVKNDFTCVLNSFIKRKSHFFG
jgi:hypothetical protein